MTADSVIMVFFVLFWVAFFVFQKARIGLFAFTATLLFAFMQLDLGGMNTSSIIWYYLFLFCLLLLDMVVFEKE
jgi:hypothetical protein